MDDPPRSEADVRLPALPQENHDLRKMTGQMRIVSIPAPRAHHLQTNRHARQANQGQGEVGHGEGAQPGGHAGVAITTGVHTGIGAVVAT